MKKIIILLLTITCFSSCKKCYDCTKKCGTCQLGSILVAGCDGDANLNGNSVDTWKIYLEAQGYTCTYNNVTEEACGSDAKSSKESSNYSCVSK